MPAPAEEVIDVFDQMMAVPLGRRAIGLTAYPANPVMAILSWMHWPRAVLARWDRMSQERPTPGVLALDAHGGIALTDGLRFEVRPGDERAPMGDTVPFNPGQTAVISVPPLGDAVVRLLRDGAVVHERPGATHLSLSLPGPGVYRAEVDLRVDLFPLGGTAYRPWIFSNPGQVRG
jgi:hypothetical protein